MNVVMEPPGRSVPVTVVTSYSQTDAHVQVGGDRPGMCIRCLYYRYQPLDLVAVTGYRNQDTGLLADLHIHYNLYFQIDLTPKYFDGKPRT